MEEEEGIVFSVTVPSWWVKTNVPSRKLELATNRASFAPDCAMKYLRSSFAVLPASFFTCIPLKGVLK